MDVAIIENRDDSSSLVVGESSASFVSLLVDLFRDLGRVPDERTG
jgi:hypothetical protein